MKVLFLIPPRTGRRLLDQSASIEGALSAAGVRTARIDLEDVPLGRFCEVVGMYRNGPAEAGTSDAPDLHGRLIAFRPQVLLVPALPKSVKTTIRELGPVLSMIPASYLLLSNENDAPRLLDIETGDKRLVQLTQPGKAVNILQDGIARAAKVPVDMIASHALPIEEISETAMRLQEIGRNFPDTVAASSGAALEGAIESVGDNEILLGDSLWVKGWIDWDETQFESLFLRIDEREWTLRPAEIRPDILKMGRAAHPLGFALEVDVSHVGCHSEVSVWGRDRSGFRHKCLSRSFWVSRDVPAASITPLISGWAEILDGRLCCRPVSDAHALRFLAVWQDGHCLAVWRRDTVEVEQDGIVELDLSIGLRHSSLVHLHVAFGEDLSVPWISLDPQTGRPPDLSRFDVSMIATARHLEHAALAEENALPEGPLRLFLDGRPAGIRHEARPDGPPIDLGRCTGMAIVEAVAMDGKRRTTRALRPVRSGLPAFVMPPGAGEISPKRLSGRIPRILLIRQSAAPTDELYVLAGLDRLAERHAIDLQIVDLKEDTTSQKDRDALLAEGTVVIVSRYLSEDWLRAILRRQYRLGGVYYLMDDDVTLAENDRDMPEHYRKRMIGVAHGEFQAMLHLCSRFIATSRFLSERFTSAKTDLLTPPYIHPCPDLDHLDDLSEIRIEYHGTSVHRADLDAISSALVRIHNTYPHVRIRTFMGRSAPQSLRSLKRVEIVGDMPWDDYREAVATSRAHIGLAPMLGTPYNRAKSFVKAMDIARFGAVGLYSRGAPYDEVITHGKNGFLLENDAAIWFQTLAWLINNPEELRRMARAGQDLAWSLSRVNHPETYWEARLFGTESFVASATIDPLLVKAGP